MKRDEGKKNPLNAVRMRDLKVEQLGHWLKATLHANSS